MPTGDAEDVVGLAFSYPAGTFIEPHDHSAHQIVHATSGTMRVHSGGKLWFVPPGRALWVPAYVTHSIECVRRVEMRTAYLSKANRSVRAAVYVVSVSDLMREVLIRLTEARSGALHPHLKQVLLNEVERGAIETLSLPVPADRRIRKLAKHLRSNPSDRTPLATWARNLGFSERSLIRKIRTETGMTFRELRRHTRVMVAIENLSLGRSVTETALDVGFETPSAFIQAFRLVTGKPPGKFFREK